MGQVREKKLVNISAINLNKMTLNWATVKKIQKGEYSFVYLVRTLPCNLHDDSGALIVFCVVGFWAAEP
jgi:hypothetical protein